MPTALANAFKLLGGFAIPLMLIAMGVSLASLRVSGLGKSLFYAVARILIGIAIGLGMGALLGLPDLARGVLLIQCAMPAAVFNYLWASYYEPQSGGRRRGGFRFDPAGLCRLAAHRGRGARSGPAALALERVRL